MKFQVVQKFPEDLDAVIVRLLDGQKPEFSELPGEVVKRLTAELKKADFKGKLGAVHYSRVPLGAKTKGVIVVGMGAECTPESSRRAVAAAVRKAREVNLEKLGTATGGRLSHEQIGQFNVEGALLADYSFDTYRKKDKPKTELSYYLVGSSPKEVRGLQAGIKRGRVAAEAAMMARDLVNEPPSRLTPTELARRAKKLTGSGVKVQVYDKAWAARQGMEAFLAVATGSDQPPKFIRLEYVPTGTPNRAGSKRKHVVLVGKGITFDAGGINLKPSRGGSLEDMKMDMAGGAAVIAVMSALKALGVKHKVTAYVAATENLLGGSAMKPGDVLRAYNGKTIEVLNTDAEGRLTLADVLSYAEKRDKPDTMIDLATLTATELSLGLDFAAVFGDEALTEELRKAGEEAGEKIWPFPLPDDYQETVKGRIAELRNTSTDRGYTINGAVFLRNFVTKKTPWVHLDIGSTASSDKDRGYLKAGGTGFGVRLLLAYLTR